MTAFLSALGVTVVALVGVVWSGVTRRRSLHYALIASMFAALGWAIYEAELYGKELVFEGHAATLKAIHMAAVTVTFLLVPFLLVSGVKLARAEGAAARQRHGQLARWFVVSVVLTCMLGTAMTWAATPRPTAGNPIEASQSPR